MCIGLPVNLPEYYRPECQEITPPPPIPWHVKSPTANLFKSLGVVLVVVLFYLLMNILTVGSLPW